MAAASVEDFLAAVPEPARTALEKLRTTIKSAAPKAVEVINYGVPMFKLDGANLVSLGAAKSHCAFYVQSPALMEAMANELTGYDTAKGTIRFAPDRPLPATLVKKIVKARIAENAALRATKAK